MDRKKIILLVAALLIAGVTAFMARSMFTGAAAPKAQAVAVQVQTGPQVLVATRQLPVGTLITADSFRYQPWPKDLVQDAYFIEENGKGPNIDDLVGTVVREPISMGEPLTKGALVSPGDRGFLAAALTPGMRAVTVPVSELTGVAGFVFPGDRVDVMLTQRVRDGYEETRPLMATETILRNIRVLALDQRSSPAVDKEGKTIVKEYKLVTLEATPAMAERISVSLSMGTLSLSLRSLADNQAELEQALATGSVSIPENATPEEEERLLAQAKKMPTNDSTYTTGGQVSRFQRNYFKAAPDTPQGRVSEVLALQRIVQNAQKGTRREEVTLSVEESKVRTYGEREVEKIRRGPVVRINRGNQTEEVQLDRR